jgi:hypothetical protein
MVVMGKHVASMRYERGPSHTKYYQENLKEEDSLRYLGVDGLTSVRV